MANFFSIFSSLCPFTKILFVLFNLYSLIDIFRKYNLRKKSDCKACIYICPQKKVKSVWKLGKWDFQFSTRFIKFPALWIFGVTLTLLVTLTFDLRPQKKNLYNPWYVLDICAKNEGDPTIGLGGVRAQTDRQTGDLPLL